jgi:hypothetical protein
METIVLGLEEQLMFPEIEYDKIDQIRGMDVSIVTTAKTQEERVSSFKRVWFTFLKLNFYCFFSFKLFSFKFLDSNAI